MRRYAVPGDDYRTGSPKDARGIGLRYAAIDERVVRKREEPGCCRRASWRRSRRWKRGNLVQPRVQRRPLTRYAMNTIAFRKTMAGRVGPSVHIVVQCEPFGDMVALHVLRNLLVAMMFKPFVSGESATMLG